MFQKVTELLHLLLAKTKAGKVDWEYLPDDEMIRASVGNGLIRIGREVTSLQRSDGQTLNDAVIYRVWVIDSRGRPCDEFVVTPFEPALYKVAEELVSAARESAK